MQAELLGGPRDGEQLTLPDEAVRVHVPESGTPLPALPTLGSMQGDPDVYFKVQGRKSVTYERLGRMTASGLREAFGLVDKRTTA